MLVNFCDPRLRPEIKCSSVCTEGYEVTNLINDPCKGFLAYSCIKPPVDIDITFLCNIKINHVLIWPSVRSQRSSGFHLYSRSTNDNSTPYTLLTSGYLDPNDAGLLFHPADIDAKNISTPTNFLQRYIRVSMRYLTSYTHSLRVTICKTENSVPALGKIEVWGMVSPRCGKDVVAGVYTLWFKQQAAAVASPVAESKTDTTSANITANNRQENEKTEELEVPESFLDIITWEIMTQPITLPSGKVIDQTTLEKYEQNEAIWGRSLSDPFTGIPFNEHRRPVMATALKMRIDKFLLENRDLNEIKKIPRVLGHDSTSTIAGDRRLIKIPKCVVNKTLLKRTATDANLNFPNVCKQMIVTDDDLQQTRKYCHKLPAVIVYPKQSTSAKLKQITKILNSSTDVLADIYPVSPSLIHNNYHDQNYDDKSKVPVIDIDSSLDDSEKTLLSNIKHFDTSEKVELYSTSGNCKCCDNGIFYRLPCKHVICRKVLLSIDNSQCKSCGFFYKSGDIERIHNILNR